jgi:hypothetical protein
MKTLTLIAIMCMISLASYSQEKRATYNNTYIGKTYDIQISFKKNGKFTFYVDALSLDKFIKTGGFEISNQQLKGFLENLEYAKQKYVEWIKIAKANNVESLSKEISIQAQKIDGYFLYGNDWHFDFYVTPTYKFIILKEKRKVNYLLMVSTGELKASNNEFMDCDGFVLVFSSLHEINHFENLFSEKKIKQFKNKPKKEDLFKSKIDKIRVVTVAHSACRNYL